MNSFMDFKAELLQIKEWKIIRLPQSISKQLPSRGMCMANVRIGKVDFIATLEPDGMGSHWFRVSDKISEKLSLKIGHKVSVSIKVLDQWPEPDVPEDFSNALRSENLDKSWNELTTKARWEWIRWIRSTSDSNTRAKRIEASCSKLSSGMKRPCCFDQTRSSEPDVSKSGILMTDFK